MALCIKVTHNVYEAFLLASPTKLTKSLPHHFNFNLILYNVSSQQGLNITKRENPSDLIVRRTNSLLTVRDLWQNRTQGEAAIRLLFLSSEEWEGKEGKIKEHKEKNSKL